MKILGVQNYSYTTNLRNTCNVNFTSKRKPAGYESVENLSKVESKPDMRYPHKPTAEEIRLNSGRANWKTPDNQRINSAEFLKSLRKIGSEKGTPLTPEEITAILDNTSNLNKKGADNVLTFVKYLKERPYHKCDAKYVREHFTYDKFKKKFGDVMPEEELKAKYKERLESEIRVVECLGKFNRFVEEAPDMRTCFNTDNWQFVEFGIAPCSNPKGLAEMVLSAGMNPDSIGKIEPLMEVYRKSHKNIAPVLDFERCFSAEDITKITQLLDRRHSNDLENYKSITYSNYYGNYVPKDINMYDAQKIILKKLNLTGKIKLVKPDVVYIDIMDRGRRLSGSYGQGKRH